MFKLMIILLFICVLIDPYIVYKIGFQYSYTISFYLITFNQLINKSKNKKSKEKRAKKFICSFFLLTPESFGIGTKDGAREKGVSFLLNHILIKI